MSLLLRGVQAALEPRGIAVEILKPDAVLRAERVPVGQMGDVFSGGQLLTAAIALYCTMAALRSNDRGRDKHRHAGTLFLDNPIGRANATYLLELQRAVSDALGVQLLYTTGPVRHDGARRVPPGDPAAQRRGPAGGPEVHQRRGAPAARPARSRTPAGETVHGEITATRMFKKPGAADRSGSRPSDAAPPGPEAAASGGSGAGRLARPAAVRGTVPSAPARSAVRAARRARRRSRRSRRAVLLGIDTTPLRWFHTWRVTQTSSTPQVARTVLPTLLITIGKASQEPASVHRNATIA